MCAPEGTVEVGGAVDFRNAVVLQFACAAGGKDRQPCANDTGGQHDETQGTGPPSTG
jgi:hypothetical protein